MVSYRVPSAEDGDKVLQAITTYLAKIKDRSSKEWVQLIDFDAVVDYLGTADNVYIVDEKFLVMYEVGIPWHTKTTWLNEKIVIAIEPGGDFQSVTDFLELKAEEAGAELVVVGTALAISDRALARVYERLGYKPSIITLTKRIASNVRRFIRRAVS